MILVTGATGNVGGALAALLTEAGQPFRALTRNVDNPTIPSGLPVVAGDLMAPETLPAAFDGVESLFLGRTGNVAAVLAEAERAGVQRVVFLSSLAAHTRPASMIGGGHLQAEQIVAESRLRWTILRPGLLASNTRLWAGMVRELGEVHAPFAEVGLPAIHPADIAAVTLAVLGGEGHTGQIYTLSGPELVTPVQRAQALADAVGRPLPFKEIDIAEARRQLTPFMPEPIADETLALTGSPLPEELPVLPTVQQLVGRPAKTFADWAHDFVHYFR